jgi:NAD(P)-dependent dehydrogenase (short-subunit alcohol dehydrogenase family)
MTDNSPHKQTWFITGAGRGMGVNFAKAALTAGHNVVATGRNPDAVAEALGDSDDLLVVKLERQSGDPAKLAQALLTITEEEQPPFRFIAGADALAQAEEKLAERRQQIDAYRKLSSSLALEEVAS